MQYDYVSDSSELGFISKEKILKYIPEKDIFNLVFGFKPTEYDYVLSPFREDRTPKCWFETGIDGRLYFRDFAFGNKPLDCFECIKIHFQLPNFYKVLEFVYNHLIKGKKLDIQEKIFIVIPKKEVKIYFNSRKFIKKDAIFWKRYEISSDNLIEDKIFPVSKYILLNSKNGDVSKRTNDICYAYADFEEGRKKLYFPNRKGNGRFITNCKKNDIGNRNNIPPFGRQIIISKSYKDCRVLRNQGKNCIWIQNEGMIPDDNVLLPLIKGFEDIVVWYDNDEAGQVASKKLSDSLSTKLNKKIRPLWLEEDFLNRKISDPSDLIHKGSKKELLYFLKQNL